MKNGRENCYARRNRSNAFSDLTEVKTRPVCVISSDVYNKSGGDFVCIPLTTVDKVNFHNLLLSSEDLLVSRVDRLSWLRTDKLFSAHVSLIEGKLGSITKMTLKKAKENIMTKVL